LGFFNGVTFEVQATKAGNKVNVDYTDQFGIMTAVPGPGGALVDPFPPILGAPLLAAGKLSLLANYNNNTVAITQ
jgi:hypothetical protein